MTADAETALAFAAARRTAIVTDGPERTQRTKVECAGLAGRVEEIVYTGALGPGAGKPSTTGFAVALRRLGMPARSALYVADNPRKDFVGPRRLGMRTLQVRRPGGVYAGETAPPGRRGRGGRAVARRARRRRRGLRARRRPRSEIEAAAALVVDAAAVHERTERAPQDQQVEPQRAMLDVVEVELDRAPTTAARRAR